MFEYFNKLVYQPFIDILLPLNPVNIIELIVIVLVILYVYLKYIKNTPSEKLFKGIIMLVFALLFSKVLIVLNLPILGKSIESLVNLVLFGLVVIFQPELRKFLGYLGQPGFLNKNIFSAELENESKNTISEITDAIKYLSKSHTGALIAMQNTTDITNYTEVGTKINSFVSAELILTIFHPNTALHDGAMVIKDDRIHSAGALLPLTEDPKLSWQYGTRHRAAIGLSEASDAICIVVSEETGNISMAKEGVLMHFETYLDLKKELETIYGYTDETSSKESKPKKFHIKLFKNAFKKKNLKTAE